MTRRLIAHLRRHVIAYLALAAALGGTGAWAAERLVEGSGSLTLRRVMLGPNDGRVLYESDFARLSFACLGLRDGELRLKNKLDHRELRPIVDSGGANPTVEAAIQPGETEAIATLSTDADRWIVSAETFRGDMLSATIVAEGGTLALEPFCRLVSSVAARS